MLKKGDVLLVLMVIFCVLACCALYNDNGPNSVASWNNLSNSSKTSKIIAIIKKDNVTIETINLSNIKDRKTIKISGQYATTIIAEHNRICFLDSNCPDEVCVKTGWLSKVGDLAVCLPNKIIIKLAQNQY